MSDSLIEQVKRLAEFQERVGVCPGWEKHQFSMLLGGTIYRGTIDFPALLAHLGRMQAAVDSARSVLVALGVDDVPYTGIKRALENLETNDGK